MTVWRWYHISMEHKKKKPYVISLKLGSVTLVGEGETALEALRAIKKPDKIISKGVMTITDGVKTKEMLFMPPKLKRIFYPNAQPVLIKWLATGLK